MIILNDMNIIRHRPPEFVDIRGAIHKILDNIDIKSVLLITSKAGSIRANHYHKKDSHYSYLLSGKAEYTEKPVEGGEIQMEVLGPGDMVFTSPMMIHAIKFLEDSEFFAFATQTRSHEEYEADTVRVTLVSEDHSHA